MKRLFLILIPLYLSGCGDNVAILTENELKNTFNSDTHAQFSTYRFNGTARLSIDGTAVLNVAGPGIGNGKDRGKWWLEGNRFCIHWQKALKGRARCANLSFDGERPQTENQRQKFAVRELNTGLKIGSFTITSR